MMKMNEAFAKILKRLRTKKNLSQEAFGFECEIHRTYVSQLERGLKSPSLKTLYKISTVLEISLEELMRLLEKEMERVSSDQ